MKTKTRQLHVLIEETTHRDLRRVACARGISLGALVRQALAALPPPPAGAPRPERHRVDRGGVARGPAGEPRL